MQAFENFDKNELINRKNELSKEYENFKKQGLNLDMSRGKPCTEQLDLSNELFGDVNNLFSEDGTDCRNYGILDGITEAKKLFAELFDVNIDEIFIAVIQA